MAKARKDLRDRALKKGEIQRKDDLRSLYVYLYGSFRAKKVYIRKRSYRAS